MDILVVNGPNLGQLGLRQPEIYGIEGMDALPELTKRLMGENFSSISLSFFQSNSEGAIIDCLEAAWHSGVSDLVLNAGVLRSEERRVGKECRSRWSPYH